MVGQAIEQRGRHLGVAEDARPFAEGEVGGDYDRGALVETADQVEQKLAAGLSERQIAKLVQDQEVEAAEQICDAALAVGASFCVELVDQVDDIEEPTPCTLGMQARAMPTARWDLPVPLPPNRTRFR